MDHAIEFESEQLLAGRVREAFRQNSYHQLRQVDCRSSGGTIVLQGTTDSFYLKQIAQAAASKVAGVERVVNEIEVARHGCDSGQRTLAK